jgi:hypothetical protein
MSPLPPSAEDGTGRDKPSVFSCVLMRDDCPTEKIPTRSLAFFDNCFLTHHACPRIFSPLTFSVPAVSTNFQLNRIGITT